MGFVFNPIVSATVPYSALGAGFVFHADDGPMAARKADESPPVPLGIRNRRHEAQASSMSVASSSPAAIASVSRL